MKDKTKQAAIEYINEFGLINLNRTKLSERLGIKPGSFLFETGWNFNELVEELKAEGHVGGWSGPLHISRTDPEMRRVQILECAAELATEYRYNRIPRKELAKAAGISESLIYRYFSSVRELGDAIMQYAVDHEMPPIVGQGLVDQHPTAIKASVELKNKTFAYLAGY